MTLEVPAEQETTWNSLPPTGFMKLISFKSAEFFVVNPEEDLSGKHKTRAVFMQVHQHVSPGVG